MKALPAHPSDRVLFYLFLALLVWVPLPLGSNRWWALAIFEFGVLALTLGWLFLYLRGRVEPGGVFERARPAVLLLVACLLWMVLQVVPLPLPMLELLSPQAAAVQAQTGAFPGLSLNRYATLEHILETLCLVLLFGLTLVLVNSRRRFRLLAIVLVASGVFQAAYGSIMTLSGLEYGFLHVKEDYRGVATGTFINRNHLAGYLEMCLAIGIGLLLSEVDSAGPRGRRAGLRRFLQSLLGHKALLRLSLAVMVIALVLTHSRMGNTAFFASLAAAGFLYMLARKRLTRGSLIFFASLLLIDVLIIGNFFGVEEVVQRLQDTSAATEHRDEVVRDSLHIVADYPLAGTGAGSYYSTYPAYSGGEVRYPYDHTHNDYVEFASEIGLVGFALLAGAVLYCLVCALRALFQRRDNLMRGVAFAALMGITALLIHSIADFNLQIPANAALFVVILALGVVSAAGRFREDGHRAVAAGG